MKRSSPTGKCKVKGNCNFIEVTTYVPNISTAPPVDACGVSVWFCTKCKRYACAGYHATGATFNYNIRICDIEGTMMFYWQKDFPVEFRKSNEHLWKWYK